MLRILHLEDSADDAFLIKTTLSRHGIAADFTLVRNRAEFTDALNHQPCNLILCDNGLPGFTGLEALRMAREKYPHIGFICVSGAAAEEQVVTSLNAGATDYVQKDQTWQLIVSVRREEERLQLMRLISELEKNVKERTDQLQAANQELQSAKRELELARSRQADTTDR